ncbi:MAG: DeoR/GlpR transcriptional regulator [Lachnospiraceae bacterium]|uniref:DeoR/GlpR transcriptional regulator n=1 Tax=Candidatus Weimeria bifida TaxID=2599074 RepID=A0A6N7J0L5_9FIRM|nr:DeoR/GlpR transcriptional regulator [Candidatus Weimeria bifida]RRF96919.1 MAG: DeoR/GlpR transcriptional regulator [Lachnospiraceae bacterium]
MLTEERFAKIISAVDSKGSVTVAELMKLLGASESTVRRDLDELDSEGRITRVRGGAISKTGSLTSKDEEISKRKGQKQKEKATIGSYAASLIKPGDFVYIDAGTTTEQMLSYITEHDATFVTNAVNHAMVLASEGFKVYILGGEFKRITEAIVGEEALDSLNKYNFTKGFFGANGITRKEGFTTPELKEAMVKRQAFLSCKDRYVLADDTKFGTVSAIGFGDFERATIITDKLTKRGFKGFKNIKELA